MRIECYCGTHGRAEFLVAGDRNTAFIITLPGNGRGNVLVGVTRHVAAGNAPNRFRDNECATPGEV